MKFLERGMKMLLVSSYPPRECGLATFSNDIVNAVNKVFGKTLPIEVCALQKGDNSFMYGNEVSYTINTSILDDYQLVAEHINERNDIGLVCIQHEFGLFGGIYGDHIIAFLLALNKPIVVIFHTVLPEPDEQRKKVVQAIINLSNKIVVLTHQSKNILIHKYGCQAKKLTIIPHGTHTVLWEQKGLLKRKYNYSKNRVLATFGLLGESKSIETVLYALKDIVHLHPEVIYLVIGKTHPEVIKTDGEKYRNKLLNIVKELQLENNVVFINKYLDLEQLLNYLTLSDIYLFTSKDPTQAVSGTFAYALSCGCAVISTPIPHAVETLKKGNGILLDRFEQPEAFKEAILHLLKNNDERMAMSRNAYSASRASNWENVAIQYGLLFGELTSSTEDLRFVFPPIKLDHIKKLTTDFGILQFSNFSQPDPQSGYTLDDNARALIDMVMYYQIKQHESILELAFIYLSFIERIQRENGWFDNFMNVEQQLTPQNSEVNLEDANGRALWSLGYLIAHKEILPYDLVRRAEICWDKAIQRIHNYSSPRAIAYAIKGLYHYQTINENNYIERQITRLSNQLLQHYHINSDHDWKWYEDYMTYSNNILPEAMMYGYLATGNQKYKKIALITFDFLLSHYFMKGQLKVISNRGWFKKENERSFYGEQPMEVVTTIIALDLFYEVTRNVKYKEQLELAFVWFLGNNHLKQLMYNPMNGASYDGLEDEQININQGAESTLCFFKAQIIMQKYMVNKTKIVAMM